MVHHPEYTPETKVIVIFFTANPSSIVAVQYNVIETFSCLANCSRLTCGGVQFSTVNYTCVSNTTDYVW